MLVTTLEAAGAEHLVIGHLLVRRIQAFRAQANQPGYDIVAVHPETNRSIKIQVKSRAATDAGGFKVKNWDFDVLVLVRLNLGERDALTASTGRKEPEPDFYVVLRESIPELEAQGEIKFRTSALPHGCRDNWSAVRQALFNTAFRPNEMFYLDEFGRRQDPALFGNDV